MVNLNLKLLKIKKIIFYTNHLTKYKLYLLLSLKYKKKICYVFFSWYFKNFLEYFYFKLNFYIKIYLNKN